MSPRSLFAVIIKVFGLLFLKAVVTTIPELLYAFWGMFKVDANNADLLIYTILTLAFYGCIVYLLLFKTNYFLDKLELEHAFDQEQFTFNLPTAKVLTIALVIIAGVVLFNEIPNLLRLFYLYFRGKQFTSEGVSTWDPSYTVLSVVKILIALLLIGERNMIIEFIEKRQMKKQGETTKEDATIN